MLNANELRIGNWVLDDGKPVQVTAKMIRAIEMLDGLYYPIPLSPEVLEACGGSKQPGGINGHVRWYVPCGRIYGITIHYQPELGWYFDCVNYPEYVDINSLHKLMNLVYTLSGTELTYKP